LQQVIITIFCAFTRGWAVDRWIENLLALNYPKGLINLVFIVDIDDPYIASRLGQIEEQYRGFTIKINREWQPNEVRPIERRKRIAEIKRQSKESVASFEADFVLGLEDDTVFENLDIDKWLQFYTGTIGIIEGVQVGRWHKNYIGAWKVDNINDPTEAVTMLPKEGYEEIDAGGFYGYLISKDNYLSLPYEYNNEPWGPDVNASLWLKRQGLTNYIDWETKFGHNDHNQILWPEGVVQYKFKKLNGVWMPVVP